jgi:hypothetical protein
MGLHITAIIHDVVSAFANRCSYALEDSRYAPKNLEVRSFTIFCLLRWLALGIGTLFPPPCPCQQRNPKC